MLWQTYLLIGTVVGMLAFLIMRRPRDEGMINIFLPVACMILSLFTWPLVLFMLGLIVANDYVLRKNRNAY